jgi:DNA (cytosine-5)-methyltransferase 1
MKATHSKEGKQGLLPWVSFKDSFEGLPIKNHHFAKFPESRLKFYRLLKSGQNWRDLPEAVQQEAMGGSWLSGGGKTGFYRRLAWEKPSPTLVTRPNMKATDLCHPQELRPLSVEEYAVLQTFPRDYAFAGNLDDQYRQIGNAVPCLLGRAIGKHLLSFDTGTLAPQEAQTNLSRYSGTDHDSWWKSIQDPPAQLVLDILERKRA